MPRVLVVDDDPSISRVLRHALSLWDVEVVAAFGVPHAVELLLSGKFEAVVIDLVLGDRSGFDVLDAMRRANVTAPVIVCAAKIPDYARILLQPQEVLTIIMKPCDNDILVSILLGLCGFDPDDDPTMIVREDQPPAP